jgi:ABC-type nitrate/sulfonate/bicarbonate transport system substrate-binding protein
MMAQRKSFPRVMQRRDKMRTPCKGSSRYSTAIVVLSLFFGALSSSASAAKVRIGGVPFYSSALTYVARDLGFWKESGLEVEIVDFAGGPLVNEALIGGGIDLGMGVGAGPAIALASRGASVAVIAGEAYSDTSAPPDHLMVAANSPIKDVKELDGKPVAVHAKGSISYVLLQVIAKSAAIKPIVLEVPAPSQFAALKRGDIVAVMAETPFPEQMEVQGGRSIYAVPNDKVVPYLAATVTLTTSKYAQEHPDVVEKVLEVEMRTARWIMDNPDRARGIITARLRYTHDVVQAISTKSYKWSRNGSFLMSSMEWWGRQMKTLGLIQSEPEYSKYFLTSYAETAEKKIGKAADVDFDTLAKYKIQ